MVTNNQPCIVVDCHVHLHDPASFGFLLNRARSNFAHCCHRTAQGVLLLAGINSSPDFKAIGQEIEKSGSEAGWTLQSTSQAHGWKAIARDGSLLWLITGRQLVSAEGLEVLVFGFEEVKNGMKIRGILTKVHAAQGLAILPWGVGKWLGGRGKIVSRLLEETPPGRIILGDNGGRPTLWAHVAQFSQAKNLKIPILRGTDSLPLKGEIDRVGSFGTIMRGIIDPEFPVSSFISLFNDPALAMDDFGSSMDFIKFLKNQILLRLRS